jgi:hypothetical protein
MPTISKFYGVTIRMYWDEHAPPHFHATHGEDEAVIRIENPAVIRGELPRRALGLILEWAALHREELMENWYLCAKGHAPRKIRPLE